jgi:hypothetical protein
LSGCPRIHLFPTTIVADARVCVEVCNVLIATDRLVRGGGGGSDGSNRVAGRRPETVNLPPLRRSRLRRLRLPCPRRRSHRHACQLIHSPLSMRQWVVGDGAGAGGGGDEEAGAAALPPGTTCSAPQLTKRTSSQNRREISARPRTIPAGMLIKHAICEKRREISARSGGVRRARRWYSRRHTVHVCHHVPNLGRVPAPSHHHHPWRYPNT